MSKKNTVPKIAGISHSKSANSKSPSVLMESAVTEAIKEFEGLKISDQGVSGYASIQDDFGDSLDVYNQTKFRLVSDIDEFYRMPDYLHNFINNPFVSYHVNYMFTRALGNGWRIVGPGAEEIEDAFMKDGTYAKLNSAWFSSFIFGISYIEVFKRRRTKKFSRTRILNPQHITITVNTNPRSPYYGEREYREFAPHMAADYPSYNAMSKSYPMKKLNRNNMVVIKNQDIPFKAYPPSPIRSILHIYKYLNDIVGDIAVAIKHGAYSPIIARLDTSAYDDEEARAVLEVFADSLEQIQSAGMNIVVDSTTDVGLIGNMGGGGGSAQMLNVVEMMKPLISVGLSNGSIPLGVYMQETANQATVEAQLEDTNVYFSRVRDDFRRQIENQIFPLITDKPAFIVFNKPPLHTEKGRKEVESLMTLYESGIISKEYIKEQLDIKDDGKSFKIEEPNELGANKKKIKEE